MPDEKKPSETAAAEPAVPEDAAFERIVERLEGIVETLEKGDLPLDESLKVFEEGVRLSRLGSKRLDDAEARIEELLSSEEIADFQRTTKREP